MESNWATEHLQTIRTLMERSAIYRRALAPIMILAGVLGTGAAVLGWAMKIGQHWFVAYWAAVALLALAGAFLLVRRQALKETEPFWSPPTRRVTAAMIPALFLGAFLAGLLFWTRMGAAGVVAPPVWMALYGCALHSAGFFMPRGIRLFAWFFLAAACLNVMWIHYGFAVMPKRDWERALESGHLPMGVAFGLLHLAYGVYLYFTEKRGNET